MPDGAIVALDDVAIAPGERTLLEHLTLRLERGVVALVGPNGVGKTSLLRAIAGTLAPRTGTIRLNDVDVRQLSPRERARRIAFVEGTEAVMAALSVAEAVAAARFPYHRWWEWDATSDDAAAIADALARTGLDPLRARELGTLSAGERQRVWIALALAQRAGVVLLDEPTAHLDLRASIDTLRLVRGVADAGALVVAVLHQLEEAAAFADRVIVLGAGGVIADGAPETALSGEVIARAFGVDVTVERRPQGLAFHRR
jgi:iron complex transport system ATP-binding protein